MSNQRRRDVVRTLGLAAVSGLSAVAGCSSPANDGTEETPETDATTRTPSETPTATPTATSTATPEPSETLTDMAGREVSVPEDVNRVVAFGPGALRTVIYLGAVGRVVGVESLETGERPSWPYAVANPGLADRPDVGSRERPDVERIRAQDAQAVFLSNASAEAADRLQSELEVPVIVVRPGGLAESHRSSFLSTLRLVGRALDRSTRAVELVQFVEEVLADLRERAPPGTPPRAYVGYVGRDDPPFARTQPGYPPFAFVGADDVAEGAGDGEAPRPVTVDPERIVEWNPTHVFVERGAGSYDAVGSERYRSVDAVQRGAVFGVLPIRDYGVNAATALANAYYVGSVLFPRAYEDVDPAAAADDLYQEFVGGPIYGDVADAYGGGFGRVDVR